MSRVLAVGAAAAAFVALVVMTRREPAHRGSAVDAGLRPTTTPASDWAGVPSEAAGVAKAAGVAEAAGISGVAGTPSTSAGYVLQTLAWGRGEGRIGLPREDEGGGETALRLTTDASGDVLLLDGENGRILRVGRDGKSLDAVPLPIKGPRDLATTKDGSLVLLDARGEGSGVTVVDSDGKVRTTITVPEEVAKVSRSVVVAGRDVYVESYRGALTRVADISGASDLSPKASPGQPTRDGSGYLNARLLEDGSGRVHVWIVERGSNAHRFSRQIQPRVLTEGIFLIDTDKAGAIYLPRRPWGARGRAP